MGIWYIEQKKKVQNNVLHAAFLCKIAATSMKLSKNVETDTAFTALFNAERIICGCGM